MCPEPEFAAAIDRLFVDGRSPIAFDRLREHVRECAECRERYERLSRVKLALDRETGVPRDQLALLGEQVIDRAAGRRLWPSRAVGLGAGALVVAAAAAVVLGVMPRSGGFQARGARAGGGEGIRAFCIEPGNPPRVVGQASAGGILSCPRSASVQFSYSSGASRYLAVVGIAPGGEILRYLGSDAATLSTAPGAVEVPLPHSTPLLEPHPGGTVEIIAVHAERSLTVAEVEAAARGHAVEGVVAQSRLQLVVTP